MTSLLTMADVSVLLPDGRALLDRLSFSLDRGQRLGIVGPSGSGKSLTALAIAGLLAEELRATGSVRLDGREILDLPEPERAKLRGRRIGMVFQEPMTALDPIRRIGDQVALPLEIHGIGTPDERRYRVEELLTAVGLPAEQVPHRLFPHQLSGGQRQRVLIAAALAAGPDLLLADEPTTALDSVVQKQILDLLDRLVRERNLALILISHDTRVLARVCTDVLTLEAGRRHRSHSVATTVGRELAGPSDEPPVLPADLSAPAGRPALEASLLVRRYRVAGAAPRLAVDEVSLRIAEGESVGLIGASGSGKSTLTRLLVGLERPDRGTVLLEGRDPASAGTARHSVQLVFQDPYDSLDPRWRIGRVVAEPLDGLGLTDGERARRVVDALAEVDLPAEIASRHPHMFSGGQRQRIALARAMVARPRLLVLDEPLSALDRQTQRQIIELLGSLRQRHRLSYLLVSHDLEVVRQLCGRVLVMNAGRIVEAGPVDRVLDQPGSAAARALREAVLAPTVAPQQGRA